MELNEFRADNFKNLEDFKAKEEAKKSAKKYQHSGIINVANEMQSTPSKPRKIGSLHR
ncbi:MULTISPECIES: hypothetical protein [Flavobacterium]|uniref:hypothetical protein n=1 Tax=Flavobacterium TaxID=237 RepID=UPI001FCC57F0|nr:MULTISPECIES: hypothetical protein [Flavobacterium]UOK42519.1 hypothetical protein LZF87_14575 [Flavobacterium enshiense]